MEEQSDPSTLAAIEPEATACFFCGNSKHPCSRCPARDAICLKCQKKGHLSKVCRGKTVNKNKNKVPTVAWSPTLATVPAGTLTSLQKSSATIDIEGMQVKALFDSGSSESFIHPSLVEKVALTVHPSSCLVSMATSASSSVMVSGTCVANLSYQGHKYDGFRLSVLPGLCADLILGLDFQSQHTSVVFHYGGSESPLSVCGFSTLNVDPPEPFANLTTDCHTIASKCRRYSEEDSAFIDEEVKRLLREGTHHGRRRSW